METNNEVVREFQREYLNTWRVLPCEQCDGLEKIKPKESIDTYITCPNCKGRKFE